MSTLTFSFDSLYFDYILGSSNLYLFLKWIVDFFIKAQLNDLCAILKACFTK